jgi:hypothetical protein
MVSQFSPRPAEASESDQESIGSQESGGVRSVKEAIIPNYDQRRGGPMASPTRIGDFSLCGDRTAPVANGVGARLKRLARRLTDALEAQHRSGVEREIARLLAQSGGRLTDSQEREIMQKVFVSDWSQPQ